MLLKCTQLNFVFLTTSNALDGFKPDIKILHVTSEKED